MGVVLQPFFLAAQETGQQPPAPARDSTPPPPESSAAILLPAPLGGFKPRLTTGPLPAEGRPDLLTGSIGFNALYTDNAFPTLSKAVDDYQYSIIPGIGFQSFGSHTQWNLNYAGGLTVDQRLAGNSQQTHGATADLQHEFTPRLTSEVREDFAITNNPFTQIGSSPSLPTISGPGQLSPFAVPSPATLIANISTANVTYLLGEHSAMGASGSFSLQHFHDVEAAPGSISKLIDTTNTAGRAFYLRQISSHQTIGAEYQLQDLYFDGGRARTVDQAVFLFDGISFTHNMTLSLYAGPEHTHIHNIIFLLPGFSATVLSLLEDRWAASGGFEYAWRTNRNGLRFSGESRVADGGGWIGTVRLNTASLELQKALSPHWAATLQLIFSDGRALGSPANLPENRITTEEGLLRFSYEIKRNLSASAQYARIREPHLGAFILVLHPDYNQVQVGLTYRFQKAFSK
ncbi:MAG TPA: hypothetical protein VKW06_11870 [Candidatus Angelobacter sp.]|nr:hypothetical protein [Candidatus Angelobacter sp.]